MDLRQKFYRMFTWALMFAFISAGLGALPVSARHASAPGDPGFTIVDSTDAGTEGDTALFKGTYVEYGVYKNGCFGSQQIDNSDLTGLYKLHPLFIDVNSMVGFLFDQGMDGWDKGTIKQTGDMFAAGSPYEMWGLAFTYNGTKYATGCAVGGGDYTDGTIDSLTDNEDIDIDYTEALMANARIEETTLAAYPGKKVAKQSANIPLTVSGSVKNDALTIEQYFITGLDDNKITMLLKVTNNTGSTLTDVVYSRGVDPDPVKELIPAVYDSLNMVTKQGPSYAEIVAHGAESSSDPYYAVGFKLGAVGSTAYANNRDENWRVTGAVDPVGSRPAVGSKYYEDQAIKVVVPYGSLANAANATFESYYILSPGDQTPGGATPTPTPAPTATPKPGGGGSATRPSLPNTGFAQGQVSVLPKQPAGMHYNSTAMRLVIPSLKVNAEIVGVPAAEKGWDVTWLGANAGYLQGSAFPTWLGNSVITGHVWNANNTPGIFVNLKTLKYGDKFTVTAYGSTYTYEVRESLQVKPWDSATLLKHYEGKSWVSLVTCEDYQLNSKSYLNRRLVRAVLVSVQ